MMQAVLGIDTSCYATSVSLVSLEREVLADIRLRLDVKHGERGLRQSEAVFQHIRQLPEAVSTAFSQAPDLGLAAICASIKPVDNPDSYMPVFLAGDSLAKSLAASHRAHRFTTTHQAGHLAAARIGLDNIQTAYLAVHLSGGTTEILHVKPDGIQTLGRTRDISAGQLLDRIGVKLGYGFPAGPEMDRLAGGLKSAQRYPAAVNGAFVSFSGAEAAALRDLDAGEISRGQIAAELFDLISRSLMKIIRFSSEKTGAEQVVITGGVAASQTLRENLLRRMNSHLPRMKTDFSLPRYAGDNAVGVAMIGLEQLKRWKETEHGADTQRQRNLGKTDY